MTNNHRASICFINVIGTGSGSGDFNTFSQESQPYDGALAHLNHSLNSD